MSGLVKMRESRCYQHNMQASEQRAFSQQRSGASVDEALKPDTEKYRVEYRHDP